MKVKADNGVITNLSFLLRDIRFAIVLSPRKIVITHTNIFVDKKSTPIKTLVCCSKTKPIINRIKEFATLAIRNFFGKTL